MQNPITDFKTVLERSETIAMIGCSPNPYRTSNYIAKFLMSKGYKVIPVNPGHDQILGETCYAHIGDISGDIQLDIVNVFRNQEHTYGVLEEIRAWKDKTGQSPVVWTQLNVSSPEAEALALRENIPYIKNQCIMVEWERNF